jgi:hypothetical protein
MQLYVSILPLLICKLGVALIGAVLVVVVLSSVCILMPLI